MQKKFAIIKDGLVDNIVVAEELDFVKLFFMDSLVVEETQETLPPHIGLRYNEEKNLFEQPNFFSSWMWDEAAFSWVAPSKYPGDGQKYYWNEAEQSWQVIDESTLNLVTEAVVEPLQN